MAAKTIRIDADDGDARAVAAAVDVLRAGGVLLFPTETVYGIGAASSRADALAKMRRLKERPDGKPFQLLAADAAMAEKIGAMFDAGAKRLAQTFWPGPLTLVVPNANSAEGETLGIRVPASELMLAVCCALGEPVIYSSANPAGRPPPKDAASADCFGDEADLLLDAGAAANGTPSTVVRCRGETYEILREGGIATESIDAVWRGEHAKG